MDIVELYVTIDDFCKKFMPRYNNLLKQKDQIKRNRAGILTPSEIILILLMFPNSNYKYFKWFYIEKVCGNYNSYFKQLPSYNRFLELIPRVLLVMLRFLQYTMYIFRKRSSIEYIDSTKMQVCHNKRTNNHKIFDGLATIGKSSMGWFFGFKLHITCNLNGELTSFNLTKGNVDDRKPVLQLMKGFAGKVFADKGYIGKKLSEQLQKIGVTLITNAKKNMKSLNLPANIIDVILHKKRSLIESVFNILKNKLQLVHTRHRSIPNFIGHLLSVLLSYQLADDKPSVHIPYMLQADCA